MTHARQQITTKECTRAKKGRQADISKTSRGSVDKKDVLWCVVIQYRSRVAKHLHWSTNYCRPDWWTLFCVQGRWEGSLAWRSVWWECCGWGSKSHFDNLATRIVSLHTSTHPALPTPPGLVLLMSACLPLLALVHSLFVIYWRARFI